MRIPRIIPYFLYCYLFMLVPEFTNNVLVNGSVVGYGLAFFMGALLSIIPGFIVQSVTHRITHSRKAVVIVSLIFFGTLGLLIEWYVLNHAPYVPTGALDALNQGILQLTMFLYWAWYVVMAWMLTDRTADVKFRSSLRRFYLKYTGVHLIVSLVLFGLGFAIGAPFLLLALVIPYFWFVGMLLLGRYVLRYMRLPKEKRSV